MLFINFFILKTVNPLNSESVSSGNVNMGSVSNYVSGCSVINDSITMSGVSSSGTCNIDISVCVSRSVSGSGSGGVGDNESITINIILYLYIFNKSLNYYISRKCQY